MTETIGTHDAGDPSAASTGSRTQKRRGRGLRVDRVHTKPGVHPYDEVTWERRDVVMTNWRDGSVNFEQRGVEFPEFWSVNAANIVTTKYFRGAVGTPQRESSLRQLIDRVVRTYRTSGEEHGYFATSEDAEVFEQELAWMLLHQVFSFNSPVWFNVGTTAPQQVSACQPYDALVNTSAGLRPIGELVRENAVGTKVYDAHGLTQVVATKANGTKNVLRIHTDAGHRLDVTADHLVWKATGAGSGRFVPAGDLRPGDQLEWHRRDCWGEAPIESREMAEAALAGWLRSGVERSDGSFEVTNDAALTWVTDALHRVGLRHEIVTAQDGRRTVRLHGAVLEDLVRDWQPVTRSTRLLSAPLPVVRAYLRSVFQVAGHVSTSGLIDLDTVSDDAARDVQTLLSRFGVFSRVLRDDHRWTVRVQSVGDLTTFADEIGFVDPEMSAELEASLALPHQPARDTKQLGISRIESLGEREVFDIQTESGEYLSGNIRVHNCFILSVDDTMESILNWYREEGLIFKGGSGAGLNLSRIRSSKELLSSGGTASGPVSFMRGADASAGTIKSGGATRRAAKMVVLDVDHPDVEEFIETKAREEDKIRALRDAGFDMDLSGADMASVQYQNANNSVRVSDEFMRAVEEERDFGLRARLTGDVVDTVDAKSLFRSMSQAAWGCADPGIQYDDTINDWHTNPETGRITASNPCSEYLSLDNSSCNLASMNLLKFLGSDGKFEAERFVKAVELVITAMDISICFADFPTDKIGETTRAYRQLGIGYANLGALLMATAHAYDSEGGRALSAAITSLLTGTAYRRSAELAGIVGPYDGFARNAEAHRRVMRKHAAASDAVRPVGSDDARILKLAGKQWQDCVRIGEKNGWRNAQASVLAPTGCLTADTLVTTDRGLVRLGELGEQYGDQWQDLDVLVSTDEGPRRANRFFVNGEEPTRRITTAGGYRIQGTLGHRVKVVDPVSGEWRWKRLADIDTGDTVPVQLGTLVGRPRQAPLPVLDQAYYSADPEARVPDVMSTELAELVGYFMGDGSLHAKGIRLCVADTDRDVLAHLTVLSKELFGLEPVIRAQQGYVEVTLQSVRLGRWWQAAGFAKRSRDGRHVGKGWVPHIPGAVLETNDADVYAAFLRGLFEADGTVVDGVPSMTTASATFADEVRTAMLAVGLGTTTRRTSSGWGGEVYQVRLRNVDHARTHGEIVGFIGQRKSRLAARQESPQSGKGDRIHLPRKVWDELVPAGHRARGAVVQSLAKTGGVSRALARRLQVETADPRLGHALGYLYERVDANDDGGLQPTYDLSVPDNVTYVASGFVSHNTIGLMMDCDTTGVEPDLALTKFKKLVGGGSMQIVNRTVPRALRSLGYQEEQVEAIVEHVSEHGNVVGAPGLRKEHYEVFDCAMGERSISPMGHVRMMAAVQPFISGGISKTVNMPESASVEDIERIYFEGWRLGLKALAIYRNNCKVGQPLSAARTEKAQSPAQPAQDAGPVRRRLPKQRPSVTTRFSVGGAEGYMTASSYPDDGLGEVFLKLGKQGSTLAGIMDAFSVAISVGLQYGIPLETYVGKFTNMRFDPAGMTDDPDVRIAGSVLDYIFRRLALDFLPYERRAELGILSAAERTAQVNDAYAVGSDEDQNADVEVLRSSAPVESTGADGNTLARGSDESRRAPSGVGSSIELVEAQQGTAADAPLCFTCGTKMRPAGSCYVCEGCGSTSGCS